MIIHRATRKLDWEDGEEKLDPQVKAWFDVFTKNKN